MSTREEIELMYLSHCAKCHAHGFPLPIPPPWMPDRFGRRAAVEREIKEEEAARLAKAERKKGRTIFVPMPLLGVFASVWRWFCNDETKRTK